MRLVVDANILFSSLIKDSITRRLILLDDFDLFTPEYVFIELEKHIDHIQKKSRGYRSPVPAQLGDHGLKHNPKRKACPGLKEEEQKGGCQNIPAVEDTIFGSARVQKRKR